MQVSTVQAYTLWPRVLSCRACHIIALQAQCCLAIQSIVHSIFQSLSHIAQVFIEEGMERSSAFDAALATDAKDLQVSWHSLFTDIYLS